MALSGSLPQINLGVQSETQGGLHKSNAKPPVLSSQASFVLIHRPTEVMKAPSTLPSPGFEPQTCGVAARCTNHSASE
ncbi:hypothetical protein TNCV_656151 [Trichonephila clavipes]|nr:hypothetical protein TNCV_656151 [Trichonephila clavipes]